MKLTKTISALFLSTVLLIATLGQANVVKDSRSYCRLTGGIITCEVAVAFLKENMVIKLNKQYFHQELVYGKQSQQGKSTLLVKAGQVMLKQTL